MLWSCIQWQGFFRMLKHHCLSPGDVLTSLEFSFLIIFVLCWAVCSSLHPFGSQQTGCMDLNRPAFSLVLPHGNWVFFLHRKVQGRHGGTHMQCQHLQGRDRNIMSSRPSSATQWVQDQPELHETLFQNGIKQVSYTHTAWKQEKRCCFYPPSIDYCRNQPRLSES